MLQPKITWWNPPNSLAEAPSVHSSAAMNWRIQLTLTKCKVLFMHCCNSLRSKFDRKSQHHIVQKSQLLTWLLLWVKKLYCQVNRLVILVQVKGKQIYFQTSSTDVIHISSKLPNCPSCPGKCYTRSPDFTSSYFDICIPTSQFLESWLQTNSSRNLWANINWIKITCILSPKLLRPSPPETLV